METFFFCWRGGGGRHFLTVELPIPPATANGKSYLNHSNVMEKYFLLSVEKSLVELSINLST